MHHEYHLFNPTAMFLQRALLTAMFLQRALLTAMFLQRALLTPISENRGPNAEMTPF